MPETEEEWELVEREMNDWFAWMDAVEMANEEVQ